MRSRILLSALALASSALSQDVPPGCGDPVVKDEPVVAYSRKPRDDKVRLWQGLELPGAANWQRARDVAGVYGWLQEEDMVLDDNGKITVIEDCTSDITRLCAATEPAWSPDGQWLAYTFNTGTRKQNVHIWGGPTTTDLWEFMVERSEIRLWNPDTGERRVVSRGPWRDFAASWASNEILVMSSDREAKYPNRAQVTADGQFHDSYPHKGAQIWRINRDGTGAVNLTEHEMVALNPWVMSNGDVCYSSWQGYGEASIGHSSPRLDYWIDCMDINGEGTFTDLGAHGYNGGIKTNAHLVGILRGGEGHTAMKALRPVGEIRRGTRTATTYYKGNSGGANGTILAYEQDAAEGALTQAEIPESTYQSTKEGSGRFLKHTLRVLTLYANDQDNEPRYEVAPPYRPAGRAGGASVSTKGRYVFQHNTGKCYRGETMDGFKTLAGELWCGREIREALQDRITNPFDPSQSRTIACHREEGVLCMTPRVRMTYREGFGIDAPAIAPIKTPVGDRGFLAVVSLPSNELRPAYGDDEKFPGQKQNNAHKDYPALAANGGRFCATYVELWAGPPQKLGYQAVGPKVCEKAEEDGSVLLEVDCKRPLVMTAESKDGLEIARDRHTHSVRCDEIRACHGCHDGHSRTRLAQLGHEDPLKRWLGTEAAKPLVEAIMRDMVNPSAGE